jgi:GYF domain 2
LSDWFIRRSNEKSGPVTTAELKSLARSGQLRPDDMIWREGQGDWVPAAHAKGLFTTQAEQAATMLAGTIVTSEAKRPTGRLSKETKVLIAGISIPILLGILFLIWFFVLRNAWERNHSVAIFALREQATDMRAHNDLGGASAKLHEILELVGTRDLKDENLRSALDDIHLELEGIDRLLVLKQLPTRLQAAANLAAADHLDEARRAYESIITAVQAKQPNSPEELSAVDRAKEGILRIEARRTTVAAADRRQEEIRVAEEQRKIQEAAQARQQEEEAARNAKIRATISGGAWTVKGGGSSDLLRGMKVYLLKPECSSASVKTYFLHSSDAAKQSSAFWRKAAKENRERPDEFGIFKKSADGYDADAEALDKYAGKVVADTKLIPERMELTDAYSLMRTITDSEPTNSKFATVRPIGDGLADVLRECAEKTTQVNIEGKFSFEGIPGGRHFLYAYWSTEFSSIEWLIPLTVADSAAISQDLFNDTARIIWNKH